MKKLAVMTLMVLGVGLGCAKQAPPTSAPTAPTQALPEATTPAPGTAPAAETNWKIESGPADAKVTVECFFPMNEDHAWVKDLNQKILDQFPGQVRIVHIDWFTEEGGKVQEEKGFPACSVYAINGKIVAQKSQELGGWTEEGLLEEIAKAVKAAYGEAAEGEEESADESKESSAAGSGAGDRGVQPEKTGGTN